MAVTAVAREVLEAQVDRLHHRRQNRHGANSRKWHLHPDDVIGSFIGWLPADAPEIIVLVKLDRPQGFSLGFQTAAPMFADLVDELVVLLDIPPDNVRLQADVMAARQGSKGLPMM